MADGRRKLETLDNHSYMGLRGLIVTEALVMQASS